MRALLTTVLAALALGLGVVSLGSDAIGQSTAVVAGDESSSCAPCSPARPMARRAGAVKGDEAKKGTGAKKKDAPKRVKIGKIDWYVDYDAALAVAKKEKKLLWLHFGENPG